MAKRKDTSAKNETTPAPETPKLDATQNVETPKIEAPKIELPKFELRPEGRACHGHTLEPDPP